MKKQNYRESVPAGHQSSPAPGNSGQPVECPVDRRAAAKILGISPSTLSRWTAMGVVPRVKYQIPGHTGSKGRVLYLPSELIDFRSRFHTNAGDLTAKPDQNMASAAKL